MMSTFVIAALLSGSVPPRDVLITPALVEVAPDRAYADVTLRNVGSEPREIFAEALAWTEDDAGQVTLSESDAVSMFPARAELAPGEERRLRLTVLDRTPVRPGAYRIAVSVRDPEMDERVVALIPAFVLPEVPIESMSVRVECERTDRCEVILTNTGNVQVRPDRVTVAIGSLQGELAERELDSWWILPGGTRRDPVALERFPEPREVLVRVTCGTVERIASAVVSGTDEEPLSPEAVYARQPTASAAERP